MSSVKAKLISTVTNHKVPSDVINHQGHSSKTCNSSEPKRDSQIRLPHFTWQYRWYRTSTHRLSPLLHSLHDAPDITVGSFDSSKADSEMIPITSPYLRQFISHWRPYHHWLLLRPTPLSSDIIQGLLGNCWFLSALALVAERPELLRTILPTSNEEFEQTKRATVRLFKSGKWHSVIVDNHLPVNSHQQLVFSQAKRKQLFVPLIEKALAKLYGGYDQLRGGLTSEGMTLLTGFPCEILWLPLSGGEQKLSPTDDHLLHEELWIKFVSYSSAGFLMGVSCGRHHEVGVPKTEYRKMGLLKEHAYSVLEVISTGQIRLVKLRNPWGSIVWNGAWSDRSPLWTSSLRSDLVPEGSEEGIFWISFTDLCRYFEMAIVCKIQPNWFQYAYEGPFTGSNPNGWTVYELQIDSHSIEMECTQSEVTATLYQELKGNKKTTPNRAIFLVLFELLNSQLSPVIGSFVSSSVCNSQGAVTMEAELKRQKRYMLGVFAFNDWHQNELQSPRSHYVLRINSSKKLLVDCFSANSVLLGDMITYFVKAMGKPIHRPNITTYQLNTDWSGLISVVENRDPRLWLQVSMRSLLKPTIESSQTTSGYSSAESLSYSQKVTPSLPTENHSDDLKESAPRMKLSDENSDRKYLASTRNALHTRDLIPPLHCQLLNVITNQLPITGSHISIKLNFHFLTFEDWFQKKLNKGSKTWDTSPVTELFHKPSIHDQAGFIYGFHCPRAFN